MIQAEIELLRCIAKNPVILQEMTAPHSGFSEQYCSSEFSQNVFRVLIQLHMTNRVNWIHFSNSLKGLSDQQRVKLREVWASGKDSNDNIDWRAVSEEMRIGYVKRTADDAIEEYEQSVQETPALITKHLGGLASAITVLSEEGEGWDPTPSAHENDPRVTYTGNWGIKGLDWLLGGGIPGYGYGLCTGPTGFGKSCFSRTIAARALLAGKSVAMVLNELWSGETFSMMLEALKLYGQTEQNSRKLIDDGMVVFEEVYEYSRLEQIVRFFRSDVTIMDSLDDLTFIPEAERYGYDDKHKSRANGFARMAAKYNTLLFITGNMSEQNQSLARKGLDKTQSAMMHGSSWYNNKAYWSWVITRDPHVNNQSLAKVTKLRHKKDEMSSGTLGQIVPFAWSPQGNCYYDGQRQMNWMPQLTQGEQHVEF